MTRIVMPDVWHAINLIAECPISSELPPGGFADDKLDSLVLAARAVANDDEPLFDMNMRRIL